MKDKINILYIPSETIGGAFYYRCLTPMMALKRNYPDKYDVFITNDISTAWLQIKNIDILIIHTCLYENKIQMKVWNLVAEAKKIGIKTVLDMDDYWYYGLEHPAFNICIANDYPIKATVNFSLFDCITVTTERFKAEIYPYNRNVFVLENAISKDDPQFTTNKIPSRRLRFGLTGGASHTNDIKLIVNENESVFDYLDKDMIDHIQFVLCGFNIQGKRIKINENGKQTQEDLNTDEVWWVQLEKLITKDYSIVSPEYKELLLKYDGSDEHYDASNEPYKRIWSKSIKDFEYGKIYDNIDVLMVPLTDTKFNSMKCISGESLVSTEQGVYRIQDLVDNEIFCNTDEGNSVINHFKYENQKTLRLITEYGYEIEGTYSHRILVDGQWKRLDEFKVGDEIELSCPNFIQTEYLKLSYPMLLTKNTENKCEFADEDMLPKITINETWGRLFGYLIGDGCFRTSGFSVSCDSRYHDVVEDVTNIIKSIGLHPIAFKKKADKRCKNCLSYYGYGVDIVATSGTFRRMCEKYGLCSGLGESFHVPDFIFKSPKSVIKEFLRGLFESDGTVGKESGVAFTTKSIELAHEVQYLLLGFGITCKILYTYNNHYRRYYYNLVLRKDESVKFMEQIGFISKLKNEKLAIFASRKNSNNHIDMNFRTKIIKIELSINDVYDVEVLNEHRFNANGIVNHNSELKFTESGFTNTAVLSSNVKPYTDYGTHGVNCLFVEDMTPKGWAYNIIKLYENEDLRNNLAFELNKKVLEECDIDLISKKRDELYSSMVKK